MTDRYDALRAAISRATPGPWQRSGTRMKWRSAGRPQELDSHTVGPEGDALAIVPFDTKSGLGLADATFIALANPATIKALLSERDSLLAALRPFATEAARLHAVEATHINDNVELWQCGSVEFTRTKITYGDLRWAAALTAKEG